MNWHRANSPGWIIVLPLDWLGILVVLTDIAHQLAIQVLHRSEDASCDHIALNARKPVLDLIEPGRVGRRVVHVNVGVFAEEVAHALCLVTAHVIADDMDFLLRSLTGHNVSEEGHELLTGMAWRSLADHLPGCCIECSKQAERAVALVFKAMTLGTPWRQWQHSVLAIQGLDRRLLVHAEHRRMCGRVQIQPDHVCGLGFEVGIVGDHVPLQPVRTHAMFAPDALHGRDGHVPQFLGKLIAAPMRRAVRRLALERVVQNARFELFRRLQRCSSRVACVQARQPLGQKSIRPTRDETRVAPQPLNDRVARLAVFKHQDQLGSARVGCPNGSAASRRQQLFTLKLGQIHFSHAPDLTTNGVLFQ
ncbi:protein of unknown function (plasmid) [Cupriavidus taiwanensis]|uniref:Uncharacterized protein n=1 Tax=Cupriavidus taiwanensis TaxID=164546 RepID=A0A375IQT2_9BURK|nr:protein of unknown function [Cupriavidus taiwanensis]SPK77412.1 protein of unknown function [Cupriavidus taiwanensis]SPK77513.1 protein of unknown function [Cupriavidus taiwanensis]SPK77580.1 protein of unknown function [Cupriavidus taiwanensis]